MLHAHTKQVTLGVHETGTGIIPIYRKTKAQGSYLTPVIKGESGTQHGLALAPILLFSPAATLRHGSPIPLNP